MIIQFLLQFEPASIRPQEISRHINTHFVSSSHLHNCAIYYHIIIRKTFIFAKGYHVKTDSHVIMIQHLYYRDNIRHAFTTGPQSSDRGHLLRSVHTCNVTVYRNTGSWQCGRDSWPRNVLKVGYAVTLRACSVCCRYLAFASKEWYGYGLSSCGRATWHVTTVSSSPLLSIPDASVLKSGANL